MTTYLMQLLSTRDYRKSMAARQVMNMSFQAGTNLIDHVGIRASNFDGMRRQFGIQVQSTVKVRANEISVNFELREDLVQNNDFTHLKLDINNLGLFKSRQMLTKLAKPSFRYK